MERAPESQGFDINQFYQELAPIMEGYEENSYVTYAIGTPEGEAELKGERSKEFYDQLMDLCAKALLKTDNKETLHTTIQQEIVSKKHKSGRDVFSGAARMMFWHNLTLSVAQKATEKPTEKPTVAEPEISDNAGAEISDDTGAEIKEVLKNN